MALTLQGLKQASRRGIVRLRTNGINPDQVDVDTRILISPANHAALSAEVSETLADRRQPQHLPTSTPERWYLHGVLVQPYEGLHGDEVIVRVETETV